MAGFPCFLCILTRAGRCNSRLPDRHACKQSDGNIFSMLFGVSQVARTEASYDRRVLY